MASLALPTNPYLLRLNIAVPVVLGAVFTLVKRDCPSLYCMDSDVAGTRIPDCLAGERIPMDCALGVSGLTLVPEESLSRLGATGLRLRVRRGGGEI